MTAKGKTRKRRHVEGVVALLRQRLGTTRARPVERFVRQFCDGIAPEDVLAFSVENLYGATLSLWKFAEQRSPGTPKVRAYNPRVEEHGWKSSHTIVEVINDDMSFLVDSLSAELKRLGLEIHLVAHPIVRLRRDKSGKRVQFFDAKRQARGAARESVMHIAVSERTDPETLEAIVAGVTKVLADVRVAVEDWRPMLDKLAEATRSLDGSPPSIDRDEVVETKAFLEWLADNNFTLLGYREYDYKGKGGEDAFEIVEGSGLGQLRDPDFHVLIGAKGLAAVSPQVLAFLRQPQLLIVTKANIRATVHRSVYMDYIGVKRFDEAGKVIGERRFVGLFTSAAYNQSPRAIPFLRRKVAQVMQRSGLAPESHDGKALMHILETFPRDELFQISNAQLYETALGILQLQERPRLRLFVRRDEFGRFASCLVYIPRERHTTELRKRFELVLRQAFNGRISTFYTQIGDAPLARIQFIVGMDPHSARAPDAAEIEARLVEAMRSWEDMLYEALVERWGEEAGGRLWSRYGASFPSAYREDFNAQVALLDIDKIETLGGAEDIAINLYRPIEEPEDAVRLKIYHPRRTAALSDCLPMLENMGLRVIEEVPYRIGGEYEDDEAAVWIHDFGMVDPSGARIDLEGLKDKFQDAFLRIWYDEVENDSLNRLVLRGGLGWREVVVLRAFSKYLRQVGIAFSQRYIEDTLVGNAAIARLLIDLFHARHDPARAKDRAKHVAALEGELGGALDAIAALDEDRILRRFLNLMETALRTNYYQRDEEGRTKTHLSFKFDSARVAELSLPRPYAEIFVYSPRVEGIHLRGGKVARGGIRWSDRREDFRTEVLGLMKAQMVKNAVIVPVGAKGGFLPKRLPAGGGRDALLQEGVACYRTFISGLLDLTDNLVGGGVVPPPDVVRYDDDDPYLVVAADKGTASFSDIANEVARSYGFWLDDAFASGGSSGYDHKKMAITARGAWESVKRHFRELGVDIQERDFTVIGVGDMSGDVFGNGMLLSKHIKLVGAFDHRHVFLDPDPDPAKSWAERKRLFELPRSSWADYDDKLISKGGGVFERAAKAVTLSPEARALLDTERDRVTPNELIRELLKTRVDLLWLGGIGTFVKATHERHSDVGDRTNEAVRVDGHELRCRVVGEGANLGLTQLGRVEYAAAGGRLNVDAVDNSAGVDCSDHEVNIKILLGAVVADGEMTRKQRDQLLVDMTDEVAELVLQHNYLQTQAISVAESQGAELFDFQARFMRALEKEGRLDRAVEGLPDDEALAERQAQPGQRGLTRPELSVLLAYAKMALYAELVLSDVPEDPYLSIDLVRYFPTPLRSRFDEALQGHRLRREIIATHIANSMVNRVGVTFVHDLAEETGLRAGDVARAYAVSRAAFELRPLWAAIEALDNKVAAAVQTEMILAARDLVHHCTEWFLRNRPRPLDIAATIEAFRPGIAVLEDGLERLLGELDAEALAEKRDYLVAQGVPADLARRVAELEPLTSACDIVLSASESAKPVDEVGRIYFLLGARLGLDWLRAGAEEIAVANHWERMAVSAIVEDLFSQQRALTNAVLRAADGLLGEDAITAWSESNRVAVERSVELIGEFQAAGGLDIARLAIANRHFHTILAAA